MGWLIAASIAFVGTHFLLSHPLRAGLVARIGDGPFLGLYSLVAFATLGWVGWAYWSMPEQPPLWPVGDGLWAIGSVVMAVASILLVGSLIGNPALPDPTARERAVPTPKGVFAITRHPMMWAFALWGLTHILVYPTPANIVLSSAIIVLALVGARAQDMKKQRLQPDFWPEWEARTSFMPFARSGAVAAAWPGWGVVAGGLALFLAATLAHIPLAGWTAGVWRWIG